MCLALVFAIGSARDTTGTTQLRPSDEAVTLIDMSGQADCAPSLNRALEKIGPAGGRLMLGPGVCWLRSEVNITKFVEIVGSGWQEGPSPAGGTWFKITEVGFTPIRIFGQQARGSTFRDIAFWQQQPPLTDAAWKPRDYPFVFDMSDISGQVGFSHIFLAGVTRGLRSLRSGRLNVDDLSGQVFDTGIEVDEAYDVPRISRVHFWPYVSSDPRIFAYQLEHADGLLSERDDNPFISDFFALGMRSALHFSASKAGHTSKFSAVNIDADLCTYGILIDADNTSGMIMNFYHQGDRPGGGGHPIVNSTSLAITANGTMVQVTNFDSRMTGHASIDIVGGSNLLKLVNAHMQAWDADKRQAAAIEVSEARRLPPNTVQASGAIDFVGGEGLRLFSPSDEGRHILIPNFLSVH